MTRTSLLLATFLLTIAATAGARERDESNVLNTPSEIAAYHTGLHQEIETKPKYEHLDETSRKAIFAAQDEVQRLAAAQTAAGRDDVIDPDLRAAHERAVQLVLEADLDRPVCQRERRTGSRLGQVACRSKRETELQRQAAREALARTRGCVANACGPDQ